MPAENRGSFDFAQDRLRPSLYKLLEHVAGGLADYQLGGDFSVGRGDLAFFEDGVDCVYNDTNRGVTHGFHGLADCRE